jgi:hypothetical protein
MDLINFNPPPSNPEANPESSEIINCLIDIFDKIDPGIILDIYYFHQNDFDKTVAALVDINSDVNPDENDRLYSVLLQQELDIRQFEIESGPGPGTGPGADYVENDEFSSSPTPNSTLAEPHIEEMSIGEKLEKFGEDIKNKITYLVRRVVNSDKPRASSSARGDYYQVPTHEDVFLEMSEINETDELLFEEDIPAQSASYTQSNIRKRK